MHIAQRNFRSLPLPSSWTVIAALMTTIFLVPIGAICLYLFAPSENWSHLVDTVLVEYVINSLWLMFGVTIGAGSIGVTTAWLTSMCRFPGRDLLSWLLLLPLAMPAYIIAYTYTGMLDVSGPFQVWIRDAFGLSYGQYWFPEVRSITGAIIMFSLVLYPYVYILARAAFIGQSICVLEVCRTLGCNRWASFSKVAVPLARPAIVAGLSLVLMETLADFGTVQYFGVSTFTTGIYRTWFGMFDAVAATQLSAILLFFVFGLIMLERWSRRRSHFHHTTNRYQRLPDIPLTQGAGLIALIACVLPLLFGFIVPTVQLMIWALQTWDVMLDHRFFDLVWHSFTLAAVAALVALIPALVLAYGNRINPSRAMRFFSRLSSMGYAIPGTVIAVGVLIPFGALDNMINNFSKEHYDITMGLFFSGTVFILLFAYTVRFLSVSLQSVEAGLVKVRPSMDDVARSMGSNRTTVLRHVHLPIIKGSLLTAILIVFVDVMKELPATLILRPFDFNTLAVRAYELASDERLADSSTAALAIVAIGIIPVILLSRAISRSRAGTQ